MKPIYIALLHHLATVKTVDLRRISEGKRQKLIDLGMMEPPLVDVEADRVFLTVAGHRALRDAATRPVEPVVNH